jgi:ribonucleoside-diphosphate reductase subunit M2
MTDSARSISRDEGLHTDFACLLFSHLQHKPSQARIYSIISSAVDIEQDFLSDALPCALIGMNRDAMCAYIEYVADRLLRALDCDALYGTSNPFDWMDNISCAFLLFRICLVLLSSNRLSNKANMFESRISSYQKARIMSNWQERDSESNKSDLVFTLDAEF